MLVLQVSEAFCSISLGEGEQACLRISGSCVDSGSAEHSALSHVVNAPGQAVTLTYAILLLDVDYKKHLLISAGILSLFKVIR